MDICIKKTELENDPDINTKNEDSIYHMNVIKIEKGFYIVFKLKRKFDFKNKRIILYN